MKKDIKNSEFQFGRPMITKMKFKLNENYKPSEETGYKFNINRSINKTTDNQAIVEVTWSTTIKEGSVNPKYEIEVAMASNFMWSNMVSEEMRDELLNYNAVSLLLGYIRPVVSIVTSNSVEPLDIPFVNLKS